MEKCLYCYKPLKPGQVDYHPACARKLFGTKETPVLPYVRKEIGDLAKQVVRAQTTLTGVQAKLSLDVNPGGKNEPSRFTIVGLWGKYKWSSSHGLRATLTCTSRTSRSTTTASWVMA